MKAETPSFSPAFSYYRGPSKESVLFSKSNLSTSYILRESLREVIPIEEGWSLVLW
jgi:hypothetical protein